MGKGYARHLASCGAALVLLVLGLPLGPARAQNFGPLDGTWEGELNVVDAKTPGQNKTTWSRVVIQEYEARVFYRRTDGQAIEVKPGKFHVQKLLTNAIVAAIDTGKDNEGRWVETWVFTVTQKDQDTLIAQFNRMVNNNNLPLSVGHSKFAIFAEGELKRK